MASFNEFRLGWRGMSMTSCWHCWVKVLPIILVLAALLGWWQSLPPSLNAINELQEPVEQETIMLDTAQNDEVGLMVTLVPAPNFSTISLSDTRKQVFISWLLPLISHENTLITKQRKEAVRLYDLWQKGRLSLRQKEWLVGVASEYEVEVERKGFTLGFWQNLLHRLDSVPPSLVLTQAAIETGWGTSRLAKDANNFFGIMCFRLGCGIKSVGSVGEFRRFANAQASVSAYMNILNTKGAYRAARMERMRNRLLGDTPSGSELAKTLLNYSELGQRYVNLLIKIMQDNQLEDYDGADISTTISMLGAPDSPLLLTEKVK